MNEEQRIVFQEQARRAAAERRILLAARGSGELRSPVRVHSDNIPANTVVSPLRLEDDVVALYNSLGSGTKARHRLSEMGVGARAVTPTQMQRSEELIAAATLLANAEDSELGARVRASGGDQRDIVDMMIGISDSDFRNDPLGQMGRPVRAATEEELAAAYGQQVTDLRGLPGEGNGVSLAGSRSEPALRPNYSADEAMFRRKLRSDAAERGLDLVTGATQRGYGLEAYNMPGTDPNTPDYVYNPAVSAGGQGVIDGRALRQRDINEGRAAAEQLVADEARIRAAGATPGTPGGYMPLPLPQRSEAEAAQARASLSKIPTMGESAYVQGNIPPAALMAEEENAIMTAEQSLAGRATPQELAARATPEQLRTIGLMGDAMRQQEGLGAPRQGVSVDEIAEVVTDPRQMMTSGDRAGAIPQSNIGQSQARVRQALAGKGVRSQVRNLPELTDALVAVGAGDLLQRPLRGDDPNDRVRAQSIANKLGINVRELDTALAGIAQSHLAQTRSNSVNPDNRDVRRGMRATTTTQAPGKQRQREATLRYEAENPGMSRTMDRVTGANTSVSKEGQRRANRGSTYRGAKQGGTDNISNGDLTYVGGTAFGKRLRENKGNMGSEAGDPTIGALRPQLQPKGRADSKGNQGWVEKERSPQNIKRPLRKPVSSPGTMAPYKQQGKGRQYSDPQMAADYARSQQALNLEAERRAIQSRTANAVTVDTIPAADNTLNAPSPTTPTTVQMQSAEQARPTAIEGERRRRMLGMMR